MIVALIDSGLGLLTTSAWLRKLRPGLDLLLFTDPEGAPWGPKPADWVQNRVVSTAWEAVSLGAKVVVLPCNTASVTALDVVREELGPKIPVIGTVPAIKPAAAECSRIAIWATAATTASQYQADLIEEFGNGAEVTGVACHGLADAIDRGNWAEIDAAIAAAAASTPPDVEGVVLGCTHYPLVEERIVRALGGKVKIFDSAIAVAKQTLRRIDEIGGGGEKGHGTVEVFHSGVPGALPDAAAQFEPGRILG